jgi:hypothetical protein
MPAERAFRGVAVFFVVRRSEVLVTRTLSRDSYCDRTRKPPGRTSSRKWGMNSSAFCIRRTRAGAGRRPSRDGYAATGRYTWHSVRRRYAWRRPNSQSRSSASHRAKGAHWQTPLTSVYAMSGDARIALPAANSPASPIDPLAAFGINTPRRLFSS